MHAMSPPPGAAPDDWPAAAAPAAVAALGPPVLDQLSDAELLGHTRGDELERRRVEALLVHRMLEIERRQLHRADGYTSLAAWGRGSQRWSDTEARARQRLAHLARRCPQVLQQLLTGRIGVAQAHLLARLAHAPRVGRYVDWFIDDMLVEAGRLSYADLELHLREWKNLVDQDGPDPERAHRERSLTIGFSDHEFRMVVNGPNIDGAKFVALLNELEQRLYQSDWAACRAEWGEQARPELMRRSPSQRRYDAWTEMLAHVGVPPTFADDPADPTDPTDPADELSDDAIFDSADGRSDASEGSAPTSSAGTTDTSPDGAIEVTVGIVIDLHTYLAGLDGLLGNPTGRDVRPPFGPGRAISHTIDGVLIDPRDAVLASLYGKTRLIVTDEHGMPIQITSTGRLFTGRMREAVLTTAVRCTHPGCLRPATQSQIDHLVPHSHGGATSVRNGGVACSHHNLWRYLTGATTRRRCDGSWTTHRKDGTELAPPD